MLKKPGPYTRRKNPLRDWPGENSLTPIITGFSPKRKAYLSAPTRGSPVN